MSPRTLNVLVVMGPVAQGGAEWQLYELLCRMDRSRFRPVLASVQFSSYKELTIGEGDRVIRDRYDALDLPHYRISGHGRNSSRNLRDLMRVIRREKIDVVHANLYAGETFGRLAAVLTGTPVVTHKRGMPFKSRKPQNILVDLLLNLCSSRIIVVNHAIRCQLQRLHHLPASRFSVIYPGIDSALWSRPDARAVAALRCALGLDAKQVVTTVGRLRPIKGQRYLLEAVPQILRECPDARFLFVGHGVEEAALRQQAEALGVDGATHFLGSRADVRELLAVSDVFVMPSLSEASPVALMEAAFCGVPSVATNVGGIPEIVREGETGLLVQPRDASAIASAVVDMLSDPHRRLRMSEAAVERARSAFDIASTVRRIEAEYERAAGLRC